MDTMIVGFDGSEPATEALRWAVREAEMRQMLVRVVRSRRDPVLGLAPTQGIAEAEAVLAADRRIEVALTEAIDRLARVHPTVKITTEETEATPAVALLDAAGPEDLTVVGARGRGGFLGLRLGSVSSRLAREATSPVVVVRGPEPEPRRGPVLVGVDGSPDARRALRWAAEEAQLRHARLRVVMAWTYLLPEEEDGPGVFRAEYGAAEAERVLRAIVDQELGPAGADAILEAPCDLAADAILQRAGSAQLVVVGAHGSGRRGPFGLGSVSQQVLHHADCPVAVIRPTSRP